jgi:hypothetical protein
VTEAKKIGRAVPGLKARALSKIDQTEPPRLLARFASLVDARFCRFFVIAVLPLALIVACGSGDGRCLRASDCDDGYACFQGTCRTGDRVEGDETRSSSSSSDAASDAKPTSLPPTDATVDALRDAAASADASDASGD